MENTITIEENSPLWNDAYEWVVTTVAKKLGRTAAEDLMDSAIGDIDYSDTTLFDGVVPAEPKETSLIRMAAPLAYPQHPENQEQRLLTRMRTMYLRHTLAAFCKDHPEFLPPPAQLAAMTAKPGPTIKKGEILERAKKDVRAIVSALYPVADAEWHIQEPDSSFFRFPKFTPGMDMTSEDGKKLRYKFVSEFSYALKLLTMNLWNNPFSNSPIVLRGVYQRAVQARIALLVWCEYAKHSDMRKQWTEKKVQRAATQESSEHPVGKKEELKQIRKNRKEEESNDEQEEEYENVDLA